MYFLYNILLLLFLLIYLPSSLFKDPLLRKYRVRWRERLGLYPSNLPREWGESRPLWVHAVSVGEMMAASPLITELMKQLPEKEICLSSVTATGNRVAAQKFPQVGALLFFPLDFRWIVRRSLRQIKPRAVLLTETELWPHFLRACSEMGIPCILINGRISQGSFRRYHWIRPFFRRMVKDMPLFCMQTEADRSRILALGAAPGRVQWTGNLKFDQYIQEERGDPRPGLLQELRIGEKVPIFIAGSTHPGEEEAAIQAFIAAKEEIADLVFILAPRHPERLPEVERLLGQSGLPWIRRSLIRPPEARQKDVILLDTMGELGRIYSLGTVVFVGGSLAPIGGHNILEPAFYGRPILFGPHMENFEEIAGLFRSGGGGMEVHGGAELSRGLLWLLRHLPEAEAMGERGRSILRQHQGAVHRTLDLLKDYL